MFTANKIRAALVLLIIAGAIYAGMGAAKFGADIKAKSDARGDAVSRYLN